ncbi:hypothetical protein ACFWBC_37650 [Streptomyces sp. NPDC059985]|uniref:hypothetical protein n=1 Tax=Streptomyces sp. NPDC059985 TaxID=3347025 RepID=UPI0036B4C987
MDESDVIDRVLQEAADLTPTPGFVNGDTYSQWYVETSVGLLKALAGLAAARGQLALTERLERFAGPMCFEVTGDKVCVAMVRAEGMPCSKHAPENGPTLGFCAYVAPHDEQPRMCKGAPKEGTDRCAEHEAHCRIVKKNGKVCGNWNCPSPAHRKARQAAARH